jgi:hypothetical protein
MSLINTVRVYTDMRDVPKMLLSLKLPKDFQEKTNEQTARTNYVSRYVILIVHRELCLKCSRRQTDDIRSRQQHAYLFSLYMTRWSQHWCICMFNNIQTATLVVWCLPVVTLLPYDWLGEDANVYIINIEYTIRWLFAVIHSVGELSSMLIPPPYVYDTAWYPVTF